VNKYRRCCHAIYIYIVLLCVPCAPLDNTADKNDRLLVRLSTVWLHRPRLLYGCADMMWPLGSGRQTSSTLAGGVHGCPPRLIHLRYCPPPSAVLARFSAETRSLPSWCTKWRSPRHAKSSRRPKSRRSKSLVGRAAKTTRWGRVLSKRTKGRSCTTCW